jgi:glycosyltransferase involved in cell wall biosynthesis
MKLSIYTAVKNGISNDLHIEAMLRHHLPLADEIVVNEGYSSDRTFERISGIDPKVKIFRSHWETPAGVAWSVGFKEAARERCTGDWCLLLDCDEFVPEWEFEAIRDHLRSTSDLVATLNYVNFYGNYRVFHADPKKVRWPKRKMVFHRNLPDFEIWGDGSNVRRRGVDFSWEAASRGFSVHHFGMVRDAATLRHKWWIQGRAMSGRSAWLSPPRVLFRLFPHDWRDPQFFEDLAIYDGPFVQAVRENPSEFVRDGMTLLKLLEARRGDR